MLVLAWASNDETAFRLPRAAALRLLNKGVLRMEGDLPDWIPDQITVPKPAAPTTQPATPSAPSTTPARQRPAARPTIPPAAPPAPEPVAQPAEPAPRNDRFSAIARIIRKLTGGDSTSSPAKVTG